MPDGSTPRSTELRASDGIDDLLVFAVRWAPHGGGAADEIQERFEMTVTEHFRSVLALLDDEKPDVLPTLVVERLRTVARRRLWLGR